MLGDRQPARLVLFTIMTTSDRDRQGRIPWHGPSIPAFEQRRLPSCETGAALPADMSNPTLTDVHRRAAARLLDAAARGVPCAPVRDLLGEASVDDAYAVQSLVHAA